MRKLMMAVMAVAGLGLTVGCQDRNKVQREQEDVAAAQRDVAQEHQEANKEVAEARQDSAENVNEAQKDLTEEQRELAAAQNEQMSEQATGGSGTTTKDTMANVKLEKVEGTIQSASANTIAIIVPDKNNQVMRFQANQQVQVMKDDKPVALKDLKAGDEVRASYQMDPNGQMLLKSIEVEKMSAQHPGAPKK
ncbi:hypothetical protein KYC5002_29255 [Archangium violaceum]|uniref:hypothetical protein n=1 Tax=Archangium violaceum TaxID=83451 RepID=UPI002B27E284|nr:hypothetical protein KYC5002_29255 [Archangium gephyra]